MKRRVVLFGTFEDVKSQVPDRSKGDWRDPKVCMYLKMLSWGSQKPIGAAKHQLGNNILSGESNDDPGVQCQFRESGRLLGSTKKQVLRALRDSSVIYGKANYFAPPLQRSVVLVVLCLTPLVASTL